MTRNPPKPARARAAVLALATAALAALPAAAQQEPPETRFQVGLTVMSGMTDLIDRIEQNNPFVQVDNALPLGLIAVAYHHFGNGLGVGASVGPVLAASGDLKFTIVPIGFDLRWRFARSGGMVPYARAGIDKAFTSGKVLHSAGVGGLVAVGAEFARPRGMGWGLELGYRSTEVEVARTFYREAQKVQPYQAVVNGFFTF